MHRLVGKGNGENISVGIGFARSQNDLQVLFYQGISFPRSGRGVVNRKSSGIFVADAHARRINV
jgi:hypothetical protein